MSRLFAFAVVVVFVASVAADDKGLTDKHVKLRAEVKLGTKQAGGLLRDGATLAAGRTFRVKSDDGMFLELVGETGFIYKNEAELFVGREMPKKNDPAPKVDPKDLWPEGTRVMGKRSNNQIQFGDRDADDKATYYELSGLALTVRKDNGDGWVRVRDRSREGWVSKDDLVTKEDALAHFDKMVKANPRDNWALFMRAASYQEGGKYDAAVEDYTEYLKLNPNDRAAFNNRGNAWMSKKEFDKAVADYTDAIKIDPTFALAYGNRGNARLHAKEYEKAVDDCDKATELDPRYAAAFGYKARALSKLGKYDDAGKSYETAAKLEPTTPRYNSYAWFLATCPDEKCRDGKKAVELSQKGIALAGKVVSWVYRDTLAAAHAEAGDFEKAVAEQEKALEDKTIVEAERKKMEARLELYKAKKPYRDDE